MPSGSMVECARPAPEMNWCSLTPKNGSSLPLPARCCSGRLATSRSRSNALRHSALSTPESAASISAALERLLGVARTQGPFSNSGTMPRVVSAQIASGLVFSAASVASSGMAAAIAAVSLGFTVSADCIGSVRRSSVSITTSVAWIFAANSFEATSATTSRAPSPPSLVIVAEVPMHRTSLPGASRSRKRLTSIATSAPCRPRYV
jgi:hypothetical protein